jgi:hypothetical protein
LEIRPCLPYFDLDPQTENPVPNAVMRLLRPLIVAVLVVASASSLAATQRTFVASTGDDANPCSLPLPCRQFAAAVARTSAGGEVIVLDSAGYGPVSITQSVSIAAPSGVYAGVSVFAGDGISINGNNIVVVLRGLTINGQGGANGIVITNANMVHVENCVIANMTAMGIDQHAGTLEVKDTIVRNNGNIGVFVQAAAQANLDRVRLEGNNTGLAAEFGGNAAMQDSVVTGSANIGVLACSCAASARTTVTVSRSLISSNSYGVYVDNDHFSGIAYAMISDSSIITNGDGVHVTSAGSPQAEILATRNTIMGNDNGLNMVKNARATLDANFFSRNVTWDVLADDTTGITTRGNNYFPHSSNSGLPPYVDPGE